MSNDSQGGLHIGDAEVGVGSLRIEGIEAFRIKSPEMVSITYTAVYDDGSFVTGVATHNGADEPLRVDFHNARGSTSPLT